MTFVLLYWQNGHIILDVWYLAFKKLQTFYYWFMCFLYNIRGSNFYSLIFSNGWIPLKF